MIENIEIQKQKNFPLSISVDGNYKTADCKYYAGVVKNSFSHNGFEFSKGDNIFFYEVYYPFPFLPIFEREQLKLLKTNDVVEKRLLTAIADDFISSKFVDKSLHHINSKTYIFAF